MLVDAHKRHITYLRLSLTDRCNLRCKYCMPDHGVHKLNHDDILTYEEFLRVVRAAAAAGMTKVRLTGGEPLVRKGFLDFIPEMAAIPGVQDLRLTTNGVLLAPMAEALLRAGIRRVNISLDSLDRETFHRIAGRDEFERVWQGIETALGAGFDKVKINMVPIRGVNDHELVAFARLSLDRRLEVRFIEFMPLGRDEFWSRDKMVTSAEIRERLSVLGELKPLSHERMDGPAQVFQLPGAKGAIGFISAITDHFCATCNRLRLTADGKLRPCLLSNQEIDIKGALRSGAGPDELSAIIRRAVMSKPAAHPLERAFPDSNRPMNMIGG